MCDPFCSQTFKQDSRPRHVSHVSKGRESYSYKNVYDQKQQETLHSRNSDKADYTKPMRRQNSAQFPHAAHFLIGHSFIANLQVVPLQRVYYVHKCMHFKNKSQTCYKCNLTFSQSATV